MLKQQAMGIMLMTKYGERHEERKENENKNKKLII